MIKLGDICIGRAVDGGLWLDDGDDGLPCDEETERKLAKLVEEFFANIRREK